MLKTALLPEAIRIAVEDWPLELVPLQDVAEQAASLRCTRSPNPPTISRPRSRGLCGVASDLVDSYAPIIVRRRDGPTAGPLL